MSYIIVLGRTVSTERIQLSNYDKIKLIALYYYLSRLPITALQVKGLNRAVFISIENATLCFLRVLHNTIN
jgi:hypothetical protein